MMQCPFCGERGARRDVHLHLVQAHPDKLEAWTDAGSGRMHYRVGCPLCGDAYEHRVKPRSRDPRFLETFAAEIRMVGFDMLLNHMEAAHSNSTAEAASEAAEAALPQAGPGGGRGRPGSPGIPLPPGMDAPDPPGIPGHTRPSTRRVERVPRRADGSHSADDDPSQPKED